MLDALPQLVNENAALVRRGNLLSIKFLVGIGGTDWLVETD